MKLKISNFNLTPQISSRLKIFLFFFFLLIFLILLTEGRYYWLEIKKAQVSSVMQGEYMVIKEIEAYQSLDDGEPVARIIPGKYFEVLNQDGNWLHIKMTRLGHPLGAEGWIKVDESAYELVKTEGIEE